MDGVGAAPCGWRGSLLGRPSRGRGGRFSFHHAGGRCLYFSVCRMWWGARPGRTSQGCADLSVSPTILSLPLCCCNTCLALLSIRDYVVDLQEHQEAKNPAHGGC
jgi:hypothetical protein